tara:strand:- start:423 stop:653 length:231 start_codon:yes stop_codon:yes gene_type:complete
MFQIFNYYVEDVIEVNQIVAIVMCIIKKLGLIVVKKIQLNNLQLPQDNVLEPLKKGLDVKIEQSTQAGIVIITNNI